MQNALRSLLAHLNSNPIRQTEVWHDWQITPIHGGWNNLLYRATSPIGDFAIKFTVRDERDRAGREYNALLALQQSDPLLAPAPLLLDRTSYSQPVVVQTWLEGIASSKMPSSADEWLCLLQHLVAVHSITPERTTIPILPGVITADQPSAAIELVYQQLSHIPVGEQPEPLRMIVQRLQATQFPVWPAPPVVLCRVDSHFGNFIRRPNAWLSVDWENSGWGDPAFEIADLTMHVAHINVPDERWDWLIQAYCNMVQDEYAALRIATYRKTRAVWYAVRLYRYLYERPRGLDQRLVALPDGWEADIRSKFQHYLVMSTHIFT